jgi:hypothetical protein
MTTAAIAGQYDRRSSDARQRVPPATFTVPSHVATTRSVQYPDAGPATRVALGLAADHEDI